MSENTEVARRITSHNYTVLLRVCVYVMCNSVYCTGSLGVVSGWWISLVTSIMQCLKPGIHYATFVHPTKLHEQMLHGVCHIRSS